MLVVVVFVELPDSLESFEAGAHVVHAEVVALMVLQVLVLLLGLPKRPFFRIKALLFSLAEGTRHFMAFLPVPCSTLVHLLWKAIGFDSTAGLTSVLILPNVEVLDQPHAQWAHAPVDLPRSQVLFAGVNQVPRKWVCLRLFFP